MVVNLSPFFAPPPTIKKEKEKSNIVVRWIVLMLCGHGVPCSNFWLEADSFIFIYSKRC
jgi:hypothetical protein